MTTGDRDDQHAPRFTMTDELQVQLIEKLVDDNRDLSNQLKDREKHIFQLDGYITDLESDLAGRLDHDLQCCCVC